MKKENVLFSIIGVLLGVIVGFVFANSVNQRATRPRPQAAAAQQQAAQQNPALPPNHPTLPSNAVADQENENIAEIQAAAQQASREPNNFDAQMKAARAHYEINRYDEALDYFMRANALRPEDYEAVVGLGNVNFDTGNYVAAEGWYTAALTKNPDDVNARTDLGLTFMFREPADFDRAIAEFRRSLQRNPKHVQTLQNLTVALIKKGEAKEARSTLTKLEEVSPNNPALSKLRSDLEQLRAPAK